MILIIDVTGEKEYCTECRIAFRDMACSRFEYVKTFEHHNRLLPGCWAVIRLDGRSFTKFAKTHDFRKPNDKRALEVCNAAAEEVLYAFDDHLAFAYGESDEYSFVLKRESELFSRRESKILSTIVSLFSSAYVFHWPRFMEGLRLAAPPAFDGRIVLYPTTKHLRDYLSWRQADTHVNNLFNTTFWALIQKGAMSTVEAEKFLKGTTSKEKNELLFSKFGINYNNEPQMFRKGTFLMKNPHLVNGGTGSEVKRDLGGGEKLSMHGPGSLDEPKFVALHEDIIRDVFWLANPHLLAPSDLNPPRIRNAKAGR